MVKNKKAGTYHMLNDFTKYRNKRTPEVNVCFYGILKR